MPNRGKNHRGRGRNVRRIMARKEHVDNRQTKVPRVMPEIKQGLVGERWVRTTTGRPALPATPWTITATGLYNAFLGNAPMTGSYIILKRLRFWIPDTTDVVNLTIDIFAGPIFISTVTSNAFTRHRTTNVEGAQSACISVELGEYWRIYPINQTATILVAQIQTLTPVTLTSIYVDCLAHVQHRPITTAVNLDSQPEDDTDNPDDDPTYKESSEKDYDIVNGVQQIAI